MKYFLIGFLALVLAGILLWMTDSESEKETVTKLFSTNIESSARSSNYLGNTLESASLNTNESEVSGEINAYDNEAITAITPNFVNAGEYYQKHLKEALAGNASSMYRVARVNDYCGEIEPGYSAAEMVDEMKAWTKHAYAQGRLDDFYKSLADMLIKDCASVWSQYLDQQHNWYELASEQGDANAEYMLNVQKLHSRLLPDSMANRLYGRAIATGDSYPMGFLAGQLAYDEKQGVVWSIVSCHYYIRCNDNIKRRNLDYRFLVNDIDDINQEADKLIGLIESGDIKNYDFFAQADLNPESRKFKLNEKHRNESLAYRPQTTNADVETGSQR